MCDETYGGSNYLFISSRDRQQWNTQTPADFTVNLQKQINLKPYVTAELVNVILPNTYNNVTVVNNTFQVNGVTYTIPTGSYDLLTYLSTMQGLVTPTIPTFKVQYNTISNNITISATPTFTFNPTISFLYKNLAFMDQTYSGSNSYTSMYAPSIDTPMFQIKMSMLGQTVTGSLSQPQFHSRGCTFIIPNTVNIGDYVFFDANTQYTMTTKSWIQILTSINVSLRNMEGMELENVADWQMTLRFS